MNNVAAWVMNNKDIILMLISILSFIFAVYKFRGELWQKTVVQDLEQFNRYFSKEGLRKLDEESILMKDMACRTISHFKGFTFSQLERFFKSDIGLYELIKILKLKRANLLEFDKSNKLIVHKKYEKRCFNRCFKSVRSYKIALWAVFTLYIIFILWCIYYFELKNTLENILVLGILIGIWEVVMLLKIENRERIEWFKNEGQEILNKNNFENLFRT